jgi:hypothetical protein
MQDAKWLILIISLPGRSGTPRMRVWRALKARGAAILRDGVYVLPSSTAHDELLREQAQEVREAGGTAYVLQYRAEETDDAARFAAFFDRAADYAQWTDKAAVLRARLTTLAEPEIRRQEAQLRREFDSIVGTDYFPGEPKARAVATLAEVTATINAHFSPDEPTAALTSIEPQPHEKYQRQCWATRESLWVDRVASAWLIRRFIDPKGRFIWLKQPSDCPPEAIGFDFDGATFSHVENYVTFEVLLRSFSLLQDHALVKLGRLVHYLDVGGLPVPEAAGFVTMLAGIKDQCADDDALLDAGSALLDHLYAGYATDPAKENSAC